LREERKQLDKAEEEPLKVVSGKGE